jgi:Ca-activated chloride channel family protein
MTGQKMLYFDQPAACWLLLLVPGLLFLIHVGTQRKAIFLRSFGDQTLLQQTASRFPALQQRWLLTTLMLLPFLGTILALADPRLPYGIQHLRTGTLDVIMVFDVSKSMAAEDYGMRSRLEQAQQVADHLLPQLRGNRVGFVTFAGTSFRQAELTDDLSALAFILQHWIKVDAIQVGGSDITQAIETALALFPNAADREQIMLLFSDGGTGEGNFHTVLQHARQRGIRIITLGFGHLKPVKIPQYDAQHTFTGYMQVQGRPILTQINAAPLQQIAAATEGLYLHLNRGDEAHHLLTQQAVVGEALERDEIKLFQLFLGIGLLSFGVHRLLTRL